MKDRTADSERQPAAKRQQSAVWQTAFGPEHGAFRGAFEHAAIGVALVALDGRFLKVNRSLCRSVGYSQEELCATDFQSITHPDDLQADLALVDQLRRGEIDHYHMEKRYFHKQG
ncbi:MAG: PAS domain S-box protein, partial [Pirellulales bacterium]